MAEQVNFGNSALAEFVVDGNEALKFKLARTPADMDDSSLEFGPEMCHQIYGDNENVFGYKGLKVFLTMSASNLKSHLSFSYDDKIDPSNTDGVKADEVLEPIVKILAPDSCTFSKEEFLRDLESENETGFRPMGELVNSFTALQDRTFQVYKCSESTPGLRDYHEKLQAWIMFFIDAASYIDIDDDSWRFFLLFEKYNSGDGSPRYSIAGYMTVYEYYAYGRETNKKRPRIAQMLVLPPFQRAGLGSRLLDTVYNDYRVDSTVVDITVEDPSDNFVRLRDFVDTRNCLKLEAFSKENVIKGFSEEIAAAAAKELKICRKQARRVYEIIRLHYTSLSDLQQYKDYRIDVKRRLNVPYQKEQSQLAKLQKALKPEEFAAAMVNITNREQRLEILSKQFQELETHYKQVLEKVAAA
jgi:histone acetyltransferase 1